MMMAEAQGDDGIFVYIGGDQEVPALVRRARIHRDVKIIPRRAFYDRRHLIYVEFHDGVEIIEESAFEGCRLLKSVKLLGVKIVKQMAFYLCTGLTDVEFGDKLETIEKLAFYACISLKKIRIPSVRTIGSGAFCSCMELSYVEYGEALRTLTGKAFFPCPKLERIALPLKVGMIEDGDVFFGCPKLTTVDLVGGIHQTVAALHMESWKSEMSGEINRINSLLPTITRGKTEAIQIWMDSVLRHLDHYKAEHLNLLKDATTLLELALWKTKLGDNEKDEKVAMERLRARTETRVTSCARIVIKNVLRVVGVRTKRGSRERTKKELRVTSGADVVIRNVLPFLQLPE